MWMASRRGPASAGRAPVLSLTSRCLARRSDTGARRRLMRRRARRLTAERARRGLRRPRAPSRTYFPREDCVLLRMTESRPQSSAGKRSSRSRSTFPILHCAPPRELSWIDTKRGLEKGDGHARTDGYECSGRRHCASRSLERQAVGPTTQARPRRRGPQDPHTKGQLGL